MSIRTATVVNASGAAIDRIEFNTIAARLGAMRLHPVTVDGATVAATVSDQTISVPLGRSLANGARRWSGSGTPRRCGAA